MIPNHKTSALKIAIPREYIYTKFSYNITSLHGRNVPYLLNSQNTAASKWGIYHISKHPEAIHIMGLKLVILQLHPFLSHLSTLAEQLILWQAYLLLMTLNQLKFIQRRRRMIDDFILRSLIV
jgi:hypothetical protein